MQPRGGMSTSRINLPGHGAPLRTMLEEIGVPSFDIIYGDEGFWIVISKTTGRALP